MSSILDSLQDGFVFLDREMRYVYVNDAALKLLARPREELIGRYVWDVFPQTADSPFREPTDRALATGQPTHVEGLNVRRGVWFDCYNYPSEHGLSIIFRDVTEQKRAEAARAESLALFRTMADAAPVLIWLAGLDRNRVFFNQGWLSYTGRTMEEELGYGWAEHIHPADYDRFLELYSSAFDECKPFTTEYRLRRHDGAYRWILANATPLFDRVGEFNGVIGTCVDIHERRLAEERLSLLAEAGEVLASSLDYETTLHHIAQLVVPRLADWFAIELLTEEGRVERVVTEHVDPKKVEWALELRRRYPVNLDSPSGAGRVIRTGQPEFAPYITEDMLGAVAQDREHLRMIRMIGLKSVIIVPLKELEQTLGAMIMVWSDTSNHYTEEDLAFAQELARRVAVAIDNAQLYRQARAAEQHAREAEAHLKVLNESLEVRVQERTHELEQRNQDLQSFASAASHDLQEPLRKFRTFLDLLREELRDPGPTAMDYMQRMDAAAERMSHFIRDLLTLSRVATHGETFGQTDLKRVVDEVLSDLEVRIGETGARIEMDDLCTIEADSLQMRQLFQNLIGNALKFRRSDMPPVIEISAEITGSANDTCRIKVKDNGIGFDEKYAERIFQPFQRLHGRSAYEGTGMGLAICRRIIERHGGAIEAHSTPGVGSQFIIDLPVSRSQPSAVPAYGHAP